jgi:hypothetical protein
MDWAERRNSERKRTLLQGRVVFNNRFSTTQNIGSKIKYLGLTLMNVV